MADLHVRENSIGAFRTLFTNVCQNADVLVLCGDLTDTGIPAEAEVLAQELQVCTIPVLCVLGNHDFENGKQQDLVHIITRGTTKFLENQPVEVQDVGFAGIKGFGGGFDHHMLQPWGEQTIKQFVHEAVNEAMVLEGALAKLRTPHKVAVLHYAPIRQTVEGEPLEIFPYLGSSRLAQALDHFGVSVAFHGHAHNGMHQGKTPGGVLVYNVSLPLLRRLNPDRPYLIVNL